MRRSSKARSTNNKNKAYSIKARVSNKNKRQQAALDFLITYGWALIIIAAILVILLYLHVFNSTSFVSNVCESQNNIYCNKAILNTSGKVLVQITSDHQNPINITAIACSNNLNNLIFQNVTPQVTLEPGQSVELAVTCYDNGNPFIGKTGSIYSGYVVVKYYDIFTDFPGVSNLAVTLHSTPELISTTSVSTTISTTSLTTSTSSTSSTSTTSTTTIPVPSGVLYYANITISNNQNQPTTNPFQEEINITPSSALWSYINTSSAHFGQNVEFFYPNGTVIPSWLEGSSSYQASFGYNYSTGGYSAASATLPSNNYYICAGGSSISGLSYVSWSPIVTTGSSYASLGTQTTQTCSGSTRSGVVVVGGYSTSIPYVSDQATTFNNVDSFSWSFNVPSNANYVIILGSCGLYVCTSVNYPADCTPEMFNGGDGYETIFAAECKLSQGTYTVTGSLNGGGYVAIAAFYYNVPVSIKGTWWVKINKINASSQEQIRIGFGSKTTNFFNNYNVGEAPQLSPTYAEYDDGADVFNFYDNFSDPYINNNLWSTLYDNGAFSDNDGLIISNNTGYQYISSKQSFKYSVVHTLVTYYYNPSSNVPYIGGVVGFIYPFDLYRAYIGSTGYYTLANPTDFEYPIIIESNNMNSSAVVKLQYIFETAYPPNGVMPSYNFSAVKKA
ncbi:MAG: hypothetical protein ARM1_0588 [Candidatus Micrarchaeota archaeon]|nr:MAG: hypothetical protein ARM1_0588 [Candidatus Micrarchaeota archaeon]